MARKPVSLHLTLEGQDLKTHDACQLDVFRILRLPRKIINTARLCIAKWLEIVARAVGSKYAKIAHQRCACVFM